MIEDRKTTDLIILMPPLDSRKRIKLQRVAMVNTRSTKPALDSRSAQKADPRSPYLVKQPNPETSLQANFKRLSQIHKTVHLTALVPRGELVNGGVEREKEKGEQQQQQDSVELHVSRPLFEVPLAEVISMKNVRLGDTLFENQQTLIRKAYCPNLGKLITIKTLKSPSQFSPIFLKPLSHKHITTFFGFQTHQNQTHIFMQFLAGGSLSDMIKQFGPFEEKVIRKYTRALLDAIAYLHRMNIVHRNIRCSNVLSDGRGNVKLGGFGMGRREVAAEGNEEQGEIQAESFVGSFYWMAPEVILPKHNTKHTKKLDIWGLGCTILQMSTGKHPWPQCKSFSDLSKRLQQHRLPTIPTHLSPDCQQFLKQCFTFQPKQRKSAEQLKQLKFACIF